MISRLTLFLLLYSLVLLTLEAEPFHRSERNVTDLIFKKYHETDKTRLASIVSALPHCINLIWNTRSFLVSARNTGVHQDITGTDSRKNYKSGSSGPVSLPEMKFLQDHDNSVLEVSVIVSAIHLILGYCSRNCSSPAELEVMIDKLASMLEIPADGTLMKEFPVNYVTTQIEVDRLPHTLREDLPEILLILQSTNYVLEIVRDMKKG
jgi:hypothetical protein